jgi:Mce-associated membrane protein
VTKKSADDEAVDVKETTTVPAETDTAAEEATEATEEVSEETTETADDADDADDADEADEGEEADAEPTKAKRRISWARVFGFGVLPGLALLLGMAAGYLKWMDSSVRDAEVARIESVQVARDSTTALLSYRPDTVEKDLGAARDRLTGTFLDAYTQLTHDVVIPGSKEKQISAVATVPAAASVSAKPDRAVVLVFVNQTVIVGQSAPTDTASSVRVTLDNIDGRWLISGFDPV